MRFVFPVRLLLYAAMALASAGWLDAGIVQVSSSAALGANDTIVWAQLGTVNLILPNTNNFTSTNGLHGNIVDGLSGVPQLRLNTLYNLLANPVYDNQFGPPVTIHFNTAVFGVGVLTMNDFGSGLPFFYHIQVFNSGGSLGTFDVASPQAANTPTYVGVLDTLPEITSVVFTTDGIEGNGGNYFALDTVNLKDNVSAAAVPEPDSIVLACLGGIALIGTRLRRRIG